ncbi:predicted protein [Postia placenta Mad-698-R]|uniref:Uncharacterized protein n=1 Tax=Postia placenta MAD-698-R-SB12 TaxID=670580 RepID=A0A1X6N605_9APHY|nr:hypothetical protein POSPLADRAFT_1136766 [Postia placenta MAD-698-R-SB12]EED78980.1 predicted protein [Postia placenta Mad-698-R]OSX64045.1 hypothetical protein POSPLADRAFT_1136766 [Postia placenta MAD-698-R-SB12]
MVVLAPRFALLAALSSLAAVSAMPTPGDGSSSSSSGSDGSDDQAQRHPKPTIPLPPIKSTSKIPKGSVKNGNAHSQDAQSGKDKRSSTWDPLDPLLQLGPICIGDKPCPERTQSRRHDHHHDKVIVKGDHDHVNVHRSILASRFARRSPHAGIVVSAPNVHVGVDDADDDADVGLRTLERRSPHDHHDKVIIEGDHDHVRVHRSPSHDRHDHDKIIVKGSHEHVNVHRSPEPHHHHDHDQEKVIVKGDHDHVNVHRSPEPEPHHHHDHHDKVVVEGNHDHVNVHRSPAPEPHHHHDHHDKVVVEGNHDHVNVHRRSGGAGSNYVAGEHGSSFIVAHTRRSDLQVSGVPGTVDIVTGVRGTGTAQQKIASLVLSAPDNSTANSDNNTAASFVLNASGTDQTQIFLVAAPSNDTNSTSWSNSEALPNSTFLDSDFVKVMLQILVFDAERAALEPYCATFDPNPPAPSPLTVEQCLNGSLTDAHKSQVFAYVPDTGVVRPMWSNNQDDQMDDQDSVGSPSTTSNSTVAATVSLTANATTTSQDPSTPTSDRPASMASLDEDFGDATHPPLRASFAKTFDAPSVFAQAHNVTLVFTPATPEVVAGKTVDSDPDDSGSAVGSANSTASATGTFSSNISASSAMASSTIVSSSASTSDTASATASSTASTSVTASATGNSISLEASVAIPSLANFVSLSQTASDSGSASTSATASSSSASPSTTAFASLAVEVYEPTASSSASGSATPSTSASVIGAEDLADSTSTAMISSSAASSMATSTSTALYEWEFREGTVRGAMDGY